jgi:cobalt/nickel transport system permease protein
MASIVLSERYQHGQGLLYHVDARVKIVSAVAFAFAVTAVPEGHWTAYAGFAALALLAVACSRLPVWLVAGRSVIALPFLLAAVPLIFTRAGETVFVVPMVGWTASSAGIVAVGSILLKSWLAVLLAVVLTATTQPVDLLRGLERMHLPRVLVATTFFMYRYLFVIGAEGQRLVRARESRSAVLDDSHRAGGRILWRGRVLGHMVGSLFIRSFERSERIYAAMLARGYDGTLRFASERRLGRLDWVVLLVMLAALGGLLAYARLTGGR